MDWRAFAEDLLEAIRRALVARGAEIAHVKLIIAGRRELDGQSHEQLWSRFVSGHLDPAASQAAMRINARVHIGPEELQAIVEGALREAARRAAQPRSPPCAVFAPAGPCRRIGLRHIGHQPPGQARHVILLNSPALLLPAST